MTMRLKRCVIASTIQLAWLGFTIFNIGCDEAMSDTENDGVSSNRHALDLETKQESRFNNNSRKGHFSPKQLLIAKWINVGKSKSVSGKAIGLSVQNNTDINLDVELKVIATGFVSHSGVLELGTHHLKPGETETFSVNADDIPLQIVEGVGQLTADVRAKLKKTRGTVEWISPIPSIFFQHSQDYQFVETFMDANILLKQKGGRLLGRKRNLTMNGQELGRLKKNSGEMKPFRASSSNLSVPKSESTKSGDLIIGMSIGDVGYGVVSPNFIEEVK